MHSRNREKYGSFGDYVLHNPSVFRGLFITSQWVPIPIFGFILYSLLMYGLWEAGVVVGVFFVLFVRRLIMFYKRGGMSSMPTDMTGYKFLWEK